MDQYVNAKLPASKDLPISAEPTEAETVAQTEAKELQDKELQTLVNAHALEQSDARIAATLAASELKDKKLVAEMAASVPDEEEDQEAEEARSRQAADTARLNARYVHQEQLATANERRAQEILLSAIHLDLQIKNN